MRKIALLLLPLWLAACTCVETDVVESIDVLRDNTHSLSEGYTALLERSGPEIPADASEEEIAELEAAWEEHVEHMMMLMGANDILADRIYEWAVAKSEDTEE